MQRQLAHNLFCDLRKVAEFLGKKTFFYLCSVIGNNLINSICYNIVLAIVMKQVLEAVEYQNSSLFWEGCVIAFFSFLIAFVFGPVFIRMKTTCVRSTIAEIRMKLAESIAFLSVGHYERIEGGDLLVRTTQDVMRLEQIYLNYIPNLCFALMHGGIAIFLMLYYNIILGIIALSLGILQSVINIRMSIKVKNYAEERQKSYGGLLQKVIELLDGWTDIIMSHSSERDLVKFEAISRGVLTKEQEAELAMKKARNVDHFFSQINRILVMGIGFFLVLKGRISVGTIAAMISLQGNANYLFQNLSDFMTGLADSLPSVRRVLETMEFEKEGNENTAYEEKGKIGLSFQDEEAAISLKNLSFGYEKNNFILKNLCIEIPKGKFVILMGESGSGKSTLGKLLLQFYEETSGEYYIFGNNSSQIEKKQIREQIAYMDQTNMIFSMSIMENLRLVREDASEQEIIEACKMAGAHDFIMEFENGYHYRINESVNNLSGGQKQRIALARMFLSKRPIYLIDEGTASLDAETEEIIIQNLVKYKGKQTILMITHRKNLISYADMVYYLVNGKIVQF